MPSKQDPKHPDVTKVVDSSKYVAVLDYNGARIFVNRSAMTASMTAKVGYCHLVFSSYIIPPCDRCAETRKMKNVKHILLDTESLRVHPWSVACST